MFNLSGSEIVFLLLLALIVLGPEKLPEAVRRFGKFYGEFKKMSTGFQSELKTALDEPMREMRETAEAFKKAANFEFNADADDDDEDTIADEPAVIEPDAKNAADAEPTMDSTTVESTTVESTPVESTPGGIEPPTVRPPGPTFHSAAPQQPKVIEAVEEPASE